MSYIDTKAIKDKCPASKGQLYLFSTVSISLDSWFKRTYQRINLFECHIPPLLAHDSLYSSVYWPFKSHISRLDFSCSWSCCPAIRRTDAAAAVFPLDVIHSDPLRSHSASSSFIYRKVYSRTLKARDPIIITLDNFFFFLHFFFFYTDESLI